MQDQVGEGDLTPKSQMASPHNPYHLPVKTKDRVHGGSVVGEGDTLVWVLECQDEKIKWRVGYFTPESLTMPPHNCYRPPIKTKYGGHGGCVVCEGNTVVWVLGCQDEKIE
jgi:hypothetical protein